MCSSDALIKVIQKLHLLESYKEAVDIMRLTRVSVGPSIEEVADSEKSKLDDERAGHELLDEALDGRLLRLLPHDRHQARQNFKEV